MKMLVFLLSILIAGNTPDLSTVRDLYSKAPSSEKECKQLIRLTSHVTERSNALLNGYKGCATMVMAKHVTNPFSKLSYFNKGKKILERSITADPANIELRYLRLTVQINAPAFLGYDDDIKNDKQILEKALQGIKDTYLSAAIQKILDQ